MNIPVHRLTTLSLVLLASCSQSRLEDHKTGKISSTQTFGLRNLTVIRIDPSGNEVQIDWKGFNVKSGNASRVPFEEIWLSAGSEPYLVSDREAGNNELVVNGRLYKFNAQSQQVLIRFGSGVSIEPGGDYQSAVKQYDVDFSQLQEDAEPAQSKEPTAGSATDGTSSSQAR